MTTPVFELMSETKLKVILDEALHVLSKVGVLIEDDYAIELLAEFGARINGDKTVFFPEDLVEKCLSTVQGSFEIFDREENPTLKMGKNEVHFDPGSSALSVFDWKMGQQRPAATQDLINFHRLIQELSGMAAQSTGLISSDVAEGIQDSYRLFIALQYCSKPVITGVFSDAGFEPMKEMLTLIRGNSEKLRQKPLAVFDCCPTSPLKWSKLGCNSLIQCALSGIPAELVPMPLMGATAPGTIAGTLVQHTVENLSGLVIHQLAYPGAPLIWGTAAVAFDMRYGTTPMGAIETMMLGSCCAKIGKLLGLPTHAYMGLSDAKMLDSQAGIETGMGALIGALSGINIISGPGMLDFLNCQSLEKLVIDNEICEMVQRKIRGVELRDGFSQDLFGDIKAGEHFLTSAHTMEWMREESFFPSTILDRESYESWEKTGGKSAGERAHQKVQEILQKDQMVGLDAKAVNELKKIMTTESRKYGAEELPKK
ncbi:hypothetical protein B6I21_02530 [candidate division KSB1 bacterium 4572_119]|nr:MAG: hypothetical protein B6I21_02530 [candidate division KSB1 bacterium 4572_119]